MHGQEFSLNAIADDGWEFEHWEGDVTSTQNPLAITVTSDMTIKAIFSIDQLSVDENSLEKTIVYPNPSSNGVFQLKTQTQKSWTVYSINGKRIIEGQGNRIDISSYAKGMYILRINNSFVKLLY